MSDAQTAAPAAQPQGESSLDKAASEVTDALDASNKENDSEELDAEVEASEEVEESEPSEEEKKKAEKKEAKKKAEAKAWKLKVGGKEVEIKDEQELLKRAQMGYAADEKWQEAAKIRKDMEAFVQALQSDPTSVLEQMGFDVDALAEQRIQQRIEEMSKSPEQLEREKLQKEIEKLRKEREQEQETMRSKEMERMQQQYAMQIENDISQALDSNKALPKSPYVVKRIADSLLLAMNNGYHDVTVTDVLPIVESQIRSEIQEMFSAMPEELVEAVIGKDVLNKVRKSRIKKTVPTKPKVEATGNTEIKKAQEANKSQDKKLSAKDFFKKLGSY